MTPRPESYFLSVSSLASGAIYVVGPNGDDDPGRALEQVVVSNTGSTAIRVATSLTGIQGTRHIVINNATSPTKLEGPYDALIFKTNTAAASTFSATGIGFYRNSARDGGVKGAQDSPGDETRYRTGRLSFTAGSTVATTATFRSPATISAIKLYAGTAPSGGTITLAVADGQGRNLLSAATFDLETLVGGTLTSLTLTGSTDLLTIARGGTVVFTVASSAGGDTCSTAFEIVYEDA